MVQNNLAVTPMVILGAFDWPYSGIRMQRFTSKNHVYENSDFVGIQRRFAASFPDKMLLRNHSAFSSKEKFCLFLFQNRVN